MITKLRISKISIETPKEGSETWIHMTVQKVFKDEDGNTVNVIPRFDYISIPYNKIGTDMYSGYDPLTNTKIEESGYGIASLITSVAIKLMMEKYGGTVNEKGDLVL